MVNLSFQHLIKEDRVAANTRDDRGSSLYAALSFLPDSFTLHSVQAFDLLFQCYRNVTSINRPFTVTDQTT